MERKTDQRLHDKSSANVFSLPGRCDATISKLNHTSKKNRHRIGLIIGPSRHDRGRNHPRKHLFGTVCSYRVATRAGTSWSQTNTRSPSYPRRRTSRRMQARLDRGRSQRRSSEPQMCSTTVGWHETPCSALCGGGPVSHSANGVNQFSARGTSSRVL